MNGGFLMGDASQPPMGQCLMPPVVPSHRCGAVPDSHRVPSYVTLPDPHILG